jgi:hypothetical protein
MTEATSGRAGPEGPPPAVLERFAAGRVARLATLSAAGPRLVPVTFAWHEGTAVWAVVGRLIRSKCTNPPGDRVYLRVGRDMLGLAGTGT